MIINKAELEAVAVKPSQYPPEDLAEIAFADNGRATCTERECKIL